MPDIEAKRLDLYNVLQKVLGNDPATTLMSHLPPVPTANLLTKEEFDGFTAGKFADFKAEFANFRTGEFADFRTETARRFDLIETRLDSLNNRIDRVLLAVIAGQFVLLAAILGTAAL